MLSIHRTLLNRLLISWIGISLAVGGAVSYFGIEKIDDQLVDIVIAESTKVTEPNLAIINNPVSDQDSVRRLIDGFMHDEFVVMEIYNRNGQKVVERVNPRYEAVESRLKRFTHKFPIDGSISYDRFKIDGLTVLQALVPLRDKAGAIAGYLEGVFIINQETLDRLRRELAVTLLIALCTVLLTTLVLYPVIISLNRNVIKFTNDLLKGNIELMEVLGGAIAKRDSDTNIHNYRVSIYAVRLAEAAQADADTIRNLIAGAFLHDVGKIGISDNILLKPAKLSEQEFAVMKTHVTLGVDILVKSNWLKTARDVVEFHHEKFNGSGYMRGLKGEEIPVNARIFAVVDVFDALTSKRPYKEPMPFEEALAILRRDSGSHFDPRLITLFEGVAEPLYRQISATPDAEVEKKLHTLIADYFFAGKSA
ncbi:MAG: HD-GYP domain-containing protein [Sterolibacterium sp.]|nr:HD-GYP domain-containing protein [Sterolibacterium sp.]